MKESDTRFIFILPRQRGRLYLKKQALPGRLNDHDPWHQPHRELRMSSFEETW